MTYYKMAVAHNQFEQGFSSLSFLGFDRPQSGFSVLLLYRATLLVFLLFVFSSCSIPMPDFKPVSEGGPGDGNLSQSPPTENNNDPVPYVPLPVEKVRPPLAGEKTAFGVVTTPAVAEAYLAYTRGEGDAALDLLKGLDQSTTDRGELWQISFLRGQVLIMMGRAADAEVELQKAERLEISFAGHNWNTRALRGEAKVWLGDYQGGIKDLLQVIQAIGNWRMQTDYAVPPSNLDDIISVASAQLRAFTGLSIAYVVKEDYELALQWAKEGEQRFNEVHYVTTHPLYGPWSNNPVDSYYGRASNLIALGLATLVTTEDTVAAEKYFEQADSFFEAINYTQGRVMTATLKSLGLKRIGNAEEAFACADQAVAYAIEKNFADMVWKIEVIRGELLLQLNRKTEAETAFRRAQTGVELISGALATDQAKLIYGVNKEDIAYYLSKIDVEKEDHFALFKDLERNRARAFVDMMAHQPLAERRSKASLAAIREIEAAVLRQRLLNSAPGPINRQGIIKEAELIEQRERLLHSLRVVDPEIADAVSISTRELVEVQQALQPGEVMAYSLPARENDVLSFLLIRPASTELLRTSLTPQKLRSHLQGFMEAIGGSMTESGVLMFGDQAKGDQKEKRGITLKVKAKKPADSAETLAGVLQAQLQLDRWKVSKTLYVVPGGDLFFVPWGAFDIDYPVSVLPTGGWLVRTPYPITAQKRISIVGDPFFNGELEQLPGARREADEISRMYQVDPLIGKEATEANLRRDMGKGVDLLHLATHGLFDKNDPLQSAVFLSGEGKPSALTAGLIYQFPLPAKLVILSACETGIGRTTSGDDLLGLIRSFYLGGTHSVLSSLWPIEDEGTALFMTTFHRYASKGEYGKGWLEARNAVKKAGLSPAVYGAFTLNGMQRSLSD